MRLTGWHGPSSAQQHQLPALLPTDVVAAQNPFDHLYRDHDVEGMTDGYDPPTAYGHIDGIDDPSMGWARYAQVRSVGQEHSQSSSMQRIVAKMLCWPSNQLRSITARLTVMYLHKVLKWWPCCFHCQG